MVSFLFLIKLLPNIYEIIIYYPKEHVRNLFLKNQTYTNMPHISHHTIYAPL